jgi:UrcA family protein
MTKRLQSSGIAALSFTLSAGLLALALTPAMAHAATGSIVDWEVTATGDRIVDSRRVDANDLDLTSDADLRLLDGRIRRAINQVCDDAGTGRNSLGEYRCRDEARLSSNRQVAALRDQAIALAANGFARPDAAVAIVAAR